MMRIQTLNPEHLSQFKRDMQEAFELGAVEGGFCQKDDEQILPESHIDRSLSTEGAVAYEAVIEEESVGGEGGREEIVGGAIVVIDKETRHGHLDFLYVKHGSQGKGIGQAIWRHIEVNHPEVTLWETCTPYFDRRNIHFYINRLGFHAVEFFWHFHPDPNDSTAADLPETDYFDGMFRFEKEQRFIFRIFVMAFALLATPMMLQAQSHDDSAQEDPFNSGLDKFFLDVDFDGNEELVILTCKGASGSASYSAYKLCPNSDDPVQRMPEPFDRLMGSWMKYGDSGRTELNAVEKTITLSSSGAFWSRRYVYQQNRAGRFQLVRNEYVSYVKDENEELKKKVEMQVFDLADE